MERELRTSKTYVKLRGKQLAGLAVPYSTPTEIGKGDSAFTEIVEPGAFRAILSTDPDVTLNVDHNNAMILGRTSAGTLHLQEDARGLNFACDLGESSYAEHIHENVARGELSGCSFGFMLSPSDQSWDDKRGGKITRHIHNFSFLEHIAIVSRPAYPGTNVDARADQLTQVAAETRSFVQQLSEQRRKAVDKSFDEIMKTNADFVIDQLRVPLQWDSDLKQRSVQDQLALMRMAANFQEMRDKGYRVEVIHDSHKWPHIVEAGMTKEERAVIHRRQRYLRDFLLN